MKKIQSELLICWQRFFIPPIQKSEVLHIRPRCLVARTLTQAMTWHITRFGVKIKGKGQPMTCHEGKVGCRGIVLPFLHYPFFNLGTRWEWVVNAMPQQLYL
jgi:hypothetical protein